MTITRVFKDNSRVAIELTSEEMEDVYRQVQHQYRRIDATNQLIDYADYCDDTDIKDLVKDYDFIEELIRSFEKSEDCNCSENATWESVIECALQKFSHM